MYVIVKLIILLTIAVIDCNGIIDQAMKGIKKAGDVMTKFTNRPCKDTTCEGKNYCFGELGCFNVNPKIWCIGREINLCPKYDEKKPSEFQLFTRKNSKLFQG